MPGFSLRNPHTIIVGALIVALLGLTAFARMPVDVFPNLKIPAVVVATFYPGMPPHGDRARHHDPLRALLHARQRHRAHRVALAARREHHQGLLPPERQRRHGRRLARQPGDGRSAPSAAGDAAAAGAQVRRLVAAGDARHRGGRGLLRGAAARSGAVQHPQPAGDGRGRVGAAALRRQVPPDHGLRRPRGARGARPDA